MAKKPVHIAFIGQKGIPALWGGVERATEELAVRMAASGYQVSAYCRVWYTKNQPSVYKGVQLKFAPAIHTKHLDTISHTFFSIIDALRSNVDVMHFQGVGPALLAWIPKIFAPKTKIFVTFHCKDRDLQKWGALARAAFFLGEFVTVRVADEIFVTSRSLQTYLLTEWNRVSTYLPNGVFEDVATENSEKYLEEFNLAPFRYVVSVARLMRDKAQHEAIEAFVRFKERAGEDFSDLKLVIVGDAADPHDSYKALLEEQAAGRTDILFVGVQTGERLKSLMKFARAGISLSYSEGMPLAILEQASYGVPLVVSDISAHREIFGEAHAYVELGDVGRAAEHLVRTIKNFDDVSVVARVLGERIRGQYCWDIIAARYSVAVVSAMTKKAAHEFESNLALTA
ncbi:MAG: glycosyltransferase family 4 protein [Candidatus Magasanikbacteria bacterium]|nr:glycosyltransferase family 4 protein [Candidatus Magasanikbacteria bacterium]